MSEKNETGADSCHRAFLFRHAEADEHTRMLTRDGKARANRVGKLWLRGQGITSVVVSDRFRTTQTSVFMQEGAGDWIVRDQAMETGWTPEEAMARWEQLETQCGDWDFEKFQQADPAFVKRETLRCGDILRRQVRAFTTSSGLIVVAHTPSVEMAVLGVTGDLIKALEPCEGVELEVREGSLGSLLFRVVRELRLGHRSDSPLESPTE